MPVHRGERRLRTVPEAHGHLEVPVEEVPGLLHAATGFGGRRQMVWLASFESSLDPDSPTDPED